MVFFENNVPPNLSDICAICREDFTEGSIVIGHSSHLFHQICVKPWLREHHTCPICRAPAEEKKNITSLLKPCLVDGVCAAVTGLIAGASGAEWAARVTWTTGLAGVSGAAGLAAGVAGAAEGVLLAAEAAGIAGVVAGAVAGEAALIAMVVVVAGGMSAVVGGAAVAAGAATVPVVETLFNRIVGSGASRENVTIGLIVSSFASLLVSPSGLPTVLSTIFLTSGIVSCGVSAYRHFFAR